MLSIVFQSIYVKLRLCEKATKLEKIFLVDLTLLSKHQFYFLTNPENNRTKKI